MVFSRTAGGITLWLVPEAGPLLIDRAHLFVGDEISAIDPADSSADSSAAGSARYRGERRVSSGIRAAGREDIPSTSTAAPQGQA